jgi:hypothetical protein
MAETPSRWAARPRPARRKTVRASWDSVIFAAIVADEHMFA